jgi:predicted CoA-binding protein
MRPVTPNRLRDNMTEREILETYHTIAAVGLSDDDTRPSYSVASYLKNAGYHIIPVNPTETEVLGEKAFPDLLSIPEPVDIVDIFRRPENVPPHVDEAIAIGAPRRAPVRAKVIWMQLGIRNEEAAAKARAAGLEVIQDRCIRAAHREMLAEA